jgi:large subunit ribosomal protein L10
MALTKQKKQDIVSELKTKIEGAESVTFVNFHGLGVTETSEMRDVLSQNDVGYSVVRKTLAKRALAETKVDGEQPVLEGELAIAYGPETAPAREVYAFQKKHEDRVSILGGIFEGRYLNKEEMLAIAQIPSIDVLRGMFVNLINSPIQRIAIALNQIAVQRSE